MCVRVCLLLCVHAYVGRSGADRLVIALVRAHELQHSLHVCTCEFTALFVHAYVHVYVGCCDAYKLSIALL